MLETKEEVNRIRKFIKNLKHPVSINYVSMEKDISWKSAKRTINQLIEKKLIKKSSIICKEAIKNIKPKRKITLNEFLSNRDNQLELV